MTLIAQRLQTIRSALPAGVTLVAVSKTYGAEQVQEAYDAGQRDFGENRVQELETKAHILPADCRWHLIGHLQSNKVRFIAPYVHLIHSVDSLALLKEISKQAVKCGRTIDCLLQMHIALEETKYGMNEDELFGLLHVCAGAPLPNVRIRGLMGMATFTDDQVRIRQEFVALKNCFTRAKNKYFAHDSDFDQLSMGMSSDWQIAVEEGSTLVRIGSSIFGTR